MIVAGVDEAGRGPVLGPMVVAGISIDESKLSKLRSMGVRDSKKLTPTARNRLYKEILRVVDGHCVCVVGPKKIDLFVARKKLNMLEADAMASVIDRLKPDVVFVDSPDVRPARFAATLDSLLKCNPRIECSHHADSTNVAVSAASIIAKVRRDMAIDKLKKKHGNIGSGYPSDRRTMRFVRRWVRRNSKAPGFARRSWKPLREMLEKYKA